MVSLTQQLQAAIAQSLFAVLTAQALCTLNQTICGKDLRKSGSNFSIDHAIYQCIGIGDSLKARYIQECEELTCRINPTDDSAYCGSCRSNSELTYCYDFLKHIPDANSSKITHPNITKYAMFKCNQTGQSYVQVAESCSMRGECRAFHEHSSRCAELCTKGEPYTREELSKLQGWNVSYVHDSDVQFVCVDGYHARSLPDCLQKCRGVDCQKVTNVALSCEDSAWDYVDNRTIPVRLHDSYVCAPNSNDSDIKMRQKHTDVCLSENCSMRCDPQRLYYCGWELKEKLGWAIYENEEYWLYKCIDGGFCAQEDSRASTNQFDVGTHDCSKTRATHGPILNNVTLHALCQSISNKSTYICSRTEKAPRLTFIATAIPAVGGFVVLVIFAIVVRKVKLKINKQKQQHLIRSATEGTQAEKVELLTHESTQSNKNMWHLSYASNDDFWNPSNWENVHKFGGGAFGTVHECRNKQTGYQCAVKAIHVPSDKDKLLNMSTKVENEIKMLKELSHPNIVQYFGSFVDETAMLIYMELVSGNSLAHNLRHNSTIMSERTVINIVVQICEAVRYLHSKFIIHRDIKPGNILLQKNNENHLIVKLADFGLSRKIHNQCSKSSAISFMGTVYYMAPEVVTATRRNAYEPYGRSADIWSVGCTIVEMFSGQALWKGKEYHAVIWSLGKRDIPDYNLPSDISTETKKLISGMLTVNPKSRPSADICLAKVKQIFSDLSTNLPSTTLFSTTL